MSSSRPRRSRSGLVLFLVVLALGALEIVGRVTGAPAVVSAVMSGVSRSFCPVVRPVQALSAADSPPPRSLPQRKSNSPCCTRTAIERSFSSLTVTELPPMIDPLTATKVSLAPWPRSITWPSVGTTAAPAVVAVLRFAQPETHPVPGIWPLKKFRIRTW